MGILHSLLFLISLGVLHGEPVPGVHKKPARDYTRKSGHNAQSKSVQDALEKNAQNAQKESSHESPYKAWLRKRSTCAYSVPPCYVSISNHPSESYYCKVQRANNVQKSRQFYQLTTLPFLPPPMDKIPFLNQTKASVALHMSLDEIDSRWLAFFGMIQSFVENMGAGLKARFGRGEFKKPEDYVKLWTMHNMMIQQFAGDFFANPTLLPTFTDVINNGRFSSDDVFVQLRLAGVCPFQIRLVSLSPQVGVQWSKLKKLLNPSFNFDASFQKAVHEWGTTMEGAVLSERLYVLYFEDFKGVPTMPDFFGGKLLNLTSPIALFARTTSGDLKVVAIQIDDSPTAPVFTPLSEPAMWARAKNLVNTVDGATCQAMWHLSHIHFSFTKYCAIFRSHFSVYHPIHQVMLYHCEGTTPHIVMMWDKLLSDSGSAAHVNSISNEGYAILAAKGHEKFTYDTLDFEQLLHRQGLNSYRLKYHPFRDDGKIIYSCIKRFAKQLTNLYYKSDWDVVKDRELQSFAAQVSVGGKGDPYGGKANIAGFPQSFETKAQVETMITRFVWQIALHSVTNYPLEPYGSFIPLGVTKLYENAGNLTYDDVYAMLPDLRTTIASTLVITTLANGRINRMFDYYDKLTDRRLQALVKRHHQHLHGCVQEMLEKRNAQRKANGLMSFQYLEPKWLTNSIHV